MQQPLDPAAVRSAFPGLQRRVGDRPAVFLDGPAGSQVPRAVADAVADYLLHHNANHGGPFPTSRETDAMVDRARQALADLFCAAEPDEVVFGDNMTTLTFHLSRSLSRTWRPGDEVVVTQSDHDANVTPWVLAARDAGAAVRHVRIHRDGTLDRDDFASKVNDRTRLVAFGAASNLTGTVHPTAELCALARERGARTYVDAVHYAPHRRMDVAAWGCDFAVCSAYKFFGPHLGALYGRRALLEELEAYKVRPAEDHGPEKWQTGTANFEGIAGALAAVDYLADLGEAAGDDRRDRLDAAFTAIRAHEDALCRELLAGLAALDGLRVVGITDPDRLDQRCATVSFVHDRVRPQALCERLAERGVFSWAGHSYAVEPARALGLLPDGVLRTGLLHYHDRSDLEGFLDALQAALAAG